MTRRRNRQDTQIVIRPTEAQIADLAHLIWRYEKQPEGKALEHWLLAERTLLKESAQKQEATARGQSRARRAKRQPPASL